MIDRERAEAQDVIDAVLDAGSELTVRDGRLKVRDFAGLSLDLQRAVRECRDAITSILAGELLAHEQETKAARQQEAAATFQAWLDADLLAGVTEPITYKPGHTIIDLELCVGRYLRQAQSGREPFASLAAHHLAEMLSAVRAVVERIEANERRAA